MAKKNRPRLKPIPQEDIQVHTVIKSFTNGTLKNATGQKVTSKEEAIALALSKTGVSIQSMQRAELRNKLVDVRKALEDKMEKELSNDKAIRTEIIKFFKANPQPTDVQMHGLAEKLQIEAPELEQLVYSILSDIISGGLSGGKDTVVDPKELEMGIAVEAEHTSDSGIAEKIARDHLAEDPKYYSKLNEANL